MTNQQLNDYIDAEFENIQSVIKNIIKEQKDIYSIVELAALASFLHNFYNALENILKRILSAKNAKITVSSSWHKDLLVKAEDSGIFSFYLRHKLLEYLSFRHFFIHMYVFNLEWTELKPLIYDINPTYEKFKKEIYAFLK